MPTALQKGILVPPPISFILQNFLTAVFPLRDVIDFLDSRLRWIDVVALYAIIAMICIKNMDVKQFEFVLSISFPPSFAIYCHGRPEASEYIHTTKK